MSPLRWEVLAAALVLAAPVLLLGLRGDLTADEVVTRLPWCLGAGWLAVTLLRWAATPPRPRPAERVPAAGAEEPPAPPV
ncbi:hypothetical protein [Geodermatophilus marinus]|uniref:hypothetical protein n=1 Tax=Geodermatophilus sp. LHW52908 TaxID=2303986 RepID=UPI000E3CF5CD|nr:hypothetical protein [Geodermatophilus sp. LHW52908]RFU22853.1 hypothetical protein D0Z06_03020 [Geodermatophilus sp. LHW52908]